MKIAYITNAGPENRAAWSGLSYYMRHGLELAGIEVEVIGSMLFPRCFGRNVSCRLGRNGWVWRGVTSGRLSRASFDSTRARSKSASKASSADVVFSSGTMLISQLKSSRPICFWTDATFATMVDYYFFRDINTEETFQHGDELERAAIGNATCGFYSSDWAAQSAIHAYHAKPERMHVVPFGANLEKPPSDEEVEKLIDERPRTPCRLLFLGVEWGRKGGDVALAVAESLTKQGVRCELNIVGCQPPPEILLPPYVKTLGFISNTTPEGQARLRGLLANSHFLILPSRADCTPIVMPEANAFGVPVLTTQTGGIPSVVQNGVNGFCAPLGESLVKDLAGHAVDLMANPERYRALCLSSRREYATRLNWNASARRIRAILEKL